MNIKVTHYHDFICTLRIQTEIQIEVVYVISTLGEKN